MEVLMFFGTLCMFAMAYGTYSIVVDDTIFPFFSRTRKVIKRVRKSVDDVAKKDMKYRDGTGVWNDGPVIDLGNFEILHDISPDLEIFFGKNYKLSPEEATSLELLILSFVELQKLKELSSYIEDERHAAAICICGTEEERMAETVRHDGTKRFLEQQFQKQKESLAQPIIHFMETLPPLRRV